MAGAERVKVRITEDLDTSQRQELVLKLEHERGIGCVYYPSTTPHVLVLEYDPERFSAATLLDLLHEHGVHARLQ